MVDKVWSLFTIARAKCVAPIVPHIVENAGLPEDEVLRRLAEHDVTPDFIKILDADHAAAKERNKRTAAEAAQMDRLRLVRRRCDPSAFAAIAIRWKLAQKPVDDEPEIPRDKAKIDARRDRVVALYQAGATIEAVAAEVCFSKKTVVSDLNARGIKRRRTGAGSSIKAPAQSFVNCDKQERERRRDRVVDLYRSGQSTILIAEAVGYSSKTVLQDLKVRGVERRDPSARSIVR